MMDTAIGDVFTLHPGDVVLGLRGDRLQTLLGSCVAIVLTDPRRTVGVMCHIVHAPSPTKAGEASGAYADMALKMMVNLLQGLGIVASKCEAYVYGGGNMFPEFIKGAGVGDRNVQWVLGALDEMGVKVLLADTGSCAYRKLSWVVGPDMPHAVAVPV